MKRFRNAAAALLALAAAACQPERHTAADYYAILPELVSIAERDAREHAAGQPSAGPVMVDPETFRGGGWQVTRQYLDVDSIFAAVKRPDARLVPHDQALILEDSLGIGGRWVREYGVWLRIPLMKWDSDELTATIASYTTDRREWPTDICERVLRVSFRQTDEDQWAHSGTEVRYECDTPRPGE